MSKCAILSTCLALALYVGHANSANAEGALNFGTSHSLKSVKFETQIEVNVYLPASYHGASTKEKPHQDYPVLYVIDGGRKQDFFHIAGLGNLASINPYIFQQVIVVGVATKNRLYQLTSLNTDKRYDRPDGDVGGADNFRAMLAQTVLPFVEENYRASPRRIVIGESLAGLFISETFLKTPELFSDYIAISPSLWYDDRALTKQASKLLSKHPDQPRKVYLSMADEGGTMQKGLDELIAAIENSKLENVGLKYVDRRDDEHHWTIYHEAALDALRWMLPVSKPAYLDEPAPWYLIEGANPPGWQK